MASKYSGNNKINKQPQKIRQNKFYKFQSEKCEDFIGARDYTQSANGLAFNQEINKDQKTSQNNNGFIRGTSCLPKEMDSTTPIMKDQNQRIILKDIFNNQDQLWKEKDIQLKGPSQSNSTKQIKTYIKTSKEKVQDNITN